MKGAMGASIESQVRRFIEENFLFAEDSASLKDSDSLIEAGLINSTGILELLSFLESEFRLQIQDAEVIPENLDSIVAITSFVAAKQAAIVEVSARTHEAKLNRSTA
jgi:acyl carrier protein